MNRCLLFCCLLLTTTACAQDPPTEQPPEVVTYLDTFFSLVSTQVLDREQFDWADLRATADSLTATAKTPADTYAGLQTILFRVNKHARIMSPDIVASWNTGGLDRTLSATSDIPVTTGRRINDRIAYLDMPSLGSGHAPTLTYFADTLQALIAALDSPTTDGWILDLRNNDGGNCWPMLAGVGPLLGEGVCGYFMNRDGSEAQSWSYQNGASQMSGYPQTQVTGTPYQLQHPAPRIAVLTGPGTTSSGEVTAIAFRGLPNTRSFGEPTGGYSTTNTNINLPDSAMILLTVSIYGDRDKNAFGEKVPPDVEAVDALAAAVRWLEGE